MKKTALVLFAALACCIMLLSSCVDMQPDESEQSVSNTLEIEPLETESVGNESIGNESEEGESEESTAEHQHDLVEHAALEPTCTEGGWYAYVTCRNCDYSTYEERPAIGHREAVNEIKEEPDCTNDGRYATIVYCTECGEELSKAELLFSALGHTEVEDKAVEPTCEETGLSAGSHCSVCGYVIAEQTEIEATGHSFVDRKCQSCEIVVVSEGLVYELNDDQTGYILTSVGDCKDKDVIIHSVYNDLPVIGIGENAFKGCEDILSVDIPDSVITIDAYAFSTCTRLRTVIFGENSRLEIIGDYAFKGCDFNDITIPDGVKSIGAFAFSSCASITKVVISEESSLLSIGDYAFYMCIWLCEISLPDSIASIGECAFANCSHIVYNEHGNAKYLGNSNNPCLVLIAGNAGITECTIPKETKIIGAYAFSNLSNLASVTFEEGSQLIQIGKEAFRNCSSLEDIEIPSGVKAIETGTFWSCSKLESVSFGEGSLIESIDIYAFDSCVSLKKITIPDGVTSIGKSAFNNCRSLAIIIISKGVKTIGEEAFQYCVSLERIVFATDCALLSIGERAFYECSAIESVTLPGMLEDIGIGAFSYCKSLASVIIPGSVKSIGGNAFENCDMFLKIYYTGTEAEWAKLNVKLSAYTSVTYDYIIIEPWDGSVATGFASGSGSESDPYVISTGAQLAYLAQVLNSDKSNTLYNKHYVLSNDIDLGGLEWDPIGRYYADSFASGGTNQLTLMGSFNGNGYTISNFKITAFNNSARRYFGLFGYLQGTVKNLTVENARIFGERGVSRIQSSYGIIAGENRSVINGCTVYDSYINVENKDSATIIYVGGIVGNNSAVIKNSSASVDIKAVNFDRLHIGGICGINYNYVGNCQYQGEIEAVSKLETVYAGGIVGNNRGEVTLCSSDVNAIAEAKKSVFGGGIVGVSTEAKVTRSYAVVNVAGSGDSVNLGGVAGHNDSYSTLKECYAYGEISTENAVSTARLGGIVGYAYGTVSNNLSLAEVSMTVADGIFAYDNGVAGTGKATNCYRYEGAKVYHNGEEITLYDTSSCTADQVNSSAFYTGTLGWSASYWDLSELNYANGKLPTLINTVIP